MFLEDNQKHWQDVAKALQLLAKHQVELSKQIRDVKEQAMANFTALNTTIADLTATVAESTKLTQSLITKLQAAVQAGDQTAIDAAVVAIAAQNTALANANALALQAGA